jgi:arylsulfatase A-like enzyme
VPLLVRWPRHVPARRVIAVPIVNTDMLPTLCALAGIEPPRSLDGESMASVLLGEASPRERTFYWHFPHYTNQGSRPAGAIRRGPWKLIEHYEDGSAELFQIEEDPGETRSRNDDEPEIARELLAALQQWRRLVGAAENRPNPAFSPELHRVIYLDTDVSRLRPAGTAAEMLPSLSAWRAAIDAAVK